MELKCVFFSKFCLKRKQSLLQRLCVSEEPRCFIASLSGQGCDPLTSETHLRALQNWIKFNMEQCNISVLLRTLSPTRVLSDCYIRVFTEMKSRLRLTIWIWFKRSLIRSMIVFFLAVKDQLAENGLLFVPADPKMMSRFSGLKGKLIPRPLLILSVWKTNTEQ